MIFVPSEIIHRVLNDVVEMFLKPKFIELGMNASGTWLNSLEVRVNGNTGEIWGMDYTYWLANGRKPNEDQSPEAINHFVKWAGYYIFKPWVESKGISISPYYVARKIATEGTNYYPNGTDLLEVLQSKEVQEYINKEIGEYLIRETQLNILRTLNKTLITV